MDHSLDDSLNLDSAMGVDFETHGDQVVSQADISLDGSSHETNLPMEFESIEEQSLMGTDNEQIIGYSDDQFSLQEYVQQQEEDMGANTTVVTSEPSMSQSDTMIDIQFDPQSFVSSPIKLEPQSQPKIIAVKAAMPPRFTALKKDPLVPSAPRQVAIAPKPARALRPLALAPAPRAAVVKKVSLAGLQCTAGAKTVLAQVGKQLVMLPAGGGQKIKLVAAAPGGVHYLRAGSDQAQLITTKNITSKPMLTKFIVQGQPADPANQPAVITKLGGAPAPARFVTMTQKTVPITMSNKLVVSSPTKQTVRISKKHPFIEIKSPPPKVMTTVQSGGTKKVVITAAPAQNVVYQNTTPNKNPPVIKEGNVTIQSTGPRTQLHQINVPGKGIQYIRLVTNPTPRLKPVPRPLPAPGKTIVLTDSKGNVIQMAAEKVPTGQPPPLVITGTTSITNKPGAKPQQKLVRIAPVGSKPAIAAAQSVGRSAQSLLAPLSPASPRASPPEPDSKAALHALLAAEPAPQTELDVEFERQQVTLHSVQSAGRAAQSLLAPLSPASPRASPPEPDSKAALHALLAAEPAPQTELDVEFERQQVTLHSVQSAGRAAQSLLAPLSPASPRASPPEPDSKAALHALLAAEPAPQTELDVEFERQQVTLHSVQSAGRAAQSLLAPLSPASPRASPPEPDSKAALHALLAAEPAPQTELDVEFERQQVTLHSVQSAGRAAQSLLAPLSPASPRASPPEPDSKAALHALLAAEPAPQTELDVEFERQQVTLHSVQSAGRAAQSLLAPLSPASPRASPPEPDSKAALHALLAAEPAPQTELDVEFERQQVTLHSVQSAGRAAQSLLAPLSPASPRASPPEPDSKAALHALLAAEPAPQTELDVEFERQQVTLHSVQSAGRAAQSLLAPLSPASPRASPPEPDSKAALHALLAAEPAPQTELDVEFERQQSPEERSSPDAAAERDREAFEQPLIVIPDYLKPRDPTDDEEKRYNNFEVQSFNSYQAPQTPQALSESELVPSELGLRPRKACNCTKSQCLKLYCDCFANGEFCNRCNCNHCHNNLENEELRQKAIRGCLDRNPNAFRPKIGKAKSGGPEIVRRHNKGCNCKRSGCLKNYCECYEAKIACTAMCKCVGCRNVEETLDRRRRDARDPRDHVFRPPALPHINFMTTEVIEAVCQCLVAAAAEPGAGGADPVRDVLDEFSRCLQDIINAAHHSAPALDESRA